jgi:hypothetical protein
MAAHPNCSPTYAHPSLLAPVHPLKSCSVQNRPQSPPRQKPARRRLFSSRARPPRTSAENRLSRDRSNRRHGLPPCPRARAFVPKDIQSVVEKRPERLSFQPVSRRPYPHPHTPKAETSPKSVKSREPEVQSTGSTCTSPSRSQSRRERSAQGGPHREERANLPSLSPGRQRQ